MIAIAVGRNADGLPLSLQLAGRPFAEAEVLRAADAFQRRTSWHRPAAGDPGGGHGDDAG